MIKGIDVSSNNGIVDWDSVKNNGYEFAIIRLGYGDDIASQDDSQFERNVLECEKRGIPYGVYLYSYALNNNEANSEVEHAKRQLKKVGSNFKLGVWFDMEDADNYKSKKGMPSNEKLSEFCNIFCKAMQEAGYKTGVYASLSWLNNQLSSVSYDKWVAHWYVDKTTYSKHYSLWQYTDKENINGKIFDCNYLVDESLLGTSSSTSKVASNTKVNVYYKVKTSKTGWLPEVKNLEDYAGYNNYPITDVAIKVDKGSIKYRVHIKGSNWLGYVTEYNTNDKINGYAGNGKPIDCIEVYYNTPNDIRPYKKAKYKVNDYSWQYDNETKNGQDGYAGAKGVNAVKFQIVIE